MGNRWRQNESFLQLLLMSFFAVFRILASLPGTAEGFRLRNLPQNKNSVVTPSGLRPGKEGGNP